MNPVTSAVEMTDSFIVEPENTVQCQTVLTSHQIVSIQEYEKLKNKNVKSKCSQLEANNSECMRQLKKMEKDIKLATYI